MEKQSQTFKDKLKRLDEIVEQISSMSLPLDESIKLYEEGSGIIKNLEQELKDAESKIETIVNQK